MTDPNSVDAMVDDSWASYSPQEQSAILVQRAFDLRLDQILPLVVAVQAADEDVGAWLAGNHGLALREQAFLLKLVQSVDVAAIEADRAALESQFGYRSVDRDLDRVYDDLDRPLFAIDAFLERPLVGTANGVVVDAYFAHQAWAPLVEASGGQHYRYPDQFKRLLTSLVAAGEDGLVERLWTMITRATVNQYLDHAKFPELSDAEAMQQLHGFALAAYDEAIRWCGSLDMIDAVASFRSDRARVEDGSALADNDNRRGK